MQKEDKKMWIWLSKLNLTPKSLKKCLEKNTIEDIWNLNESIYFYFTKEEIGRIEDKRKKVDLQKDEAFLNKHEINLLTIRDADYPCSLKNIEDPPIVLYTFGNIELLNKNLNIAIVGARRCTEYGKTVATAFSYLLAKKNIVITSGLAAGIDRAAHEGALIAKGKTIAVLGTGIDIIYPKENERLFKEIINKTGLIISEFPIGTKPEKLNFPRRNRIISGLADGVLVVEAEEKSGALITADFALEQGKNVYSVPRKYIKQYF